MAVGLSLATLPESLIDHLGASPRITGDLRRVADRSCDGRLFVANFKLDGLSGTLCSHAFKTAAVRLVTRGFRSLSEAITEKPQGVEQTRLAGPIRANDGNQSRKSVLLPFIERLPQRDILQCPVVLNLYAFENCHSPRLQRAYRVRPGIAFFADNGASLAQIRQPRPRP